MLAAVVGEWGAMLVNFAVVISLGGAMLSYTILCVDSAFGPSVNGAFPRIFSEKNKHGAPTWAVIITAIIVQAFILIIHFNDATFQACYALSTSAIMVPYVFSAFYYFKVVAKGEDMEHENGKRFIPWVIAIFGSIYGFWLLYASGVTYILAASLLYAPGTIMYIYNRKSKGQNMFNSSADAAVCLALMIATVVAFYMTVSGKLQWF